MKKKGFTLIEIIISLTLIISVSVITIIILNKNKVNNKVDKKQKELEAAVDVIADKLRTKNSLKEFVISEEETSSEIISYFCLTKETLISEGILTEESEILKSLNDDQYIKVSQDQVGTYVYKHPVLIEECNYIKGEINNTDFDGTLPPKSGEDDKGNKYTLNQFITPKENVDNTYEFKMDFEFETGKLVDTSYRPNIYTVFVVDGSGSMSSSEFKSVRDAAINLSETLIQNNNNSQICTSTHGCNFVSAVTFNGSIRKDVGFKKTVLTTSDFPSSGSGGTNYTNALNNAYNKIVSIDTDKVNNRFFVIFLSDGAPGDSKTSYEAKANMIKNFIKPSGETTEYGKLITVGFNYNDSKLSDFASNDCKGSGTKCYYQSTSDAIDDVFEDFFNVIQKQVVCSTYKQAEIEIKLSNNFIFSGENNFKTITKDLNCDESNLTSDIQIQKLLENEEYSLTFVEPKEDDLEIGTKEYPIISEININFKDAYGQEISDAKVHLNGDDFPKIKLDISSISVIN